MTRKPLLLKHKTQLNYQDRDFEPVALHTLVDQRGHAEPASTDILALLPLELGLLVLWWAGPEATLRGEAVSRSWQDLCKDGLLWKGFFMDARWRARAVPLPILRPVEGMTISYAVDVWPAPPNDKLQRKRGCGPNARSSGARGDDEDDKESENKAVDCSMVDDEHSNEKQNAEGAGQQVTAPSTPRLEAACREKGRKKFSSHTAEWDLVVSTPLLRPTGCWSCDSLVHEDTSCQSTKARERPRGGYRPEVLLRRLRSGKPIKTKKDDQTNWRARYREMHEAYRTYVIPKTMATARYQPRRQVMGLNSPSRHELRFLVVGASKTGKSSLISRFTTNSFSREAAASFRDHKVCSLDVRVANKPMSIRLCTTTAEESCMLRDHKILNADCFFVVFSLTSRRSLLEALTLMHLMRSIVAATKSKQIPIVLIGNKCDVDDSLRKVSSIKACKTAAKFGACYVETSAKTGTNVHRMFLYTALQIHRQRAQKKSAKRQGCVVS